MADENSPLIINDSSKTRPSSKYLSSLRSHLSCFPSKEALVVLIWASIIFTFRIPVTKPQSNESSNVFHWIILIVTMFYLLYPILAYLGERWTRYNVMMIGLSMFSVSWVVNSILNLIQDIREANENSQLMISLDVINALNSVILYFGFRLFQANIIQFGTDQLQFSPSVEVASFARWFICTFTLPICVAGFVWSFIDVYTPHAAKGILYGISAVVLILINASIILSCCYKRQMIIEPPVHIDPVKMIWRVMKYAWKHKYPVRRSAFTYCEGPPSRLDLAKERYGGPFTTEQVEDVKSFWNIIVVLLSMTGYTLSGTEGVGQQYINVLKRDNTTLTLMENIVLQYSETILFSIVVIGVCILQMVIVPFFPRYIPSMLKRMWIGLVFVLLSVISLTVISGALNKTLQGMTNTTVCGEHGSNWTLSTESNLWPYYVLVVPQFLNGIGVLFNFVAILEFIIAQGPRHMQGLLIGVWYAQITLGNIQEELATSRIGCYWEYHALISGIVFISLIIYSIVAYRYKYRQRNEISDINVRVTIEEIYERRLETDAKMRARSKEQMFMYMYVE